MKEKVTKIVRSKVPELAKENNVPGDFLKVNLRRIPVGDTLFREKILEEAQEVFEASNREELITELCDLHQAIEEFMEFKGIGSEDVGAMMEAKKVVRGTFLAPRPMLVTTGYYAIVMNPTDDMKEATKKNGK